MKVVCISGKARHGKTTAAIRLRNELQNMGYKVLITNYADLLKYICEKFFGWNGEKNEKGRTLLQHIGTDVIRKKNPDYWVNFIVDILRFFKDEWDYVLIPDCRFPNEIERIKSAGIDVITLRIERENFQNDLTEEQQNHISETALDDFEFDLVIKNTTLRDFFNQIKSLADCIKKMDMKKFTILVDMDDTIENLLVCWIHRLNEKYGTKVQYEDVKYWNMEKIFPSLTSEQIFEPLHDETIWDEVEPTEGSVKYMQKLIHDRHDVYIVTSSHYNTVKPKFEKFLQKYFPFVSWNNVIIASKKQMIRGDILIDDGVHNLMGGKYIKILMDAPHNQYFCAAANDTLRVYTWKEIYNFINELAIKAV